MKVLATTSILTLLVSLLIAVAHYGTAQAAAEVSGILSSDTTWTKANSPYTLTGPVGVKNGVTLTIEPGVSVNGNYIEVNGTLVAKGSSNNKIQLNVGSIIFTKTSTSWNESTSTGCIIENADISSTQIQIKDSSPKIKSSTINANMRYFYVIEVWGGSPIISNNNITGGAIGLLYAGSGYSNASISDNIISGSREGIEISSMGTPMIERNLITHNTEFGIYLLQPPGESSPIIRNNTIAKNSIGFNILCPYSPSISPTIVFNNIYANNEHNVYLDSGYSPNINATYNWWGTSDASEISQTIYDFERDFSLGTVTFVPFLNKPNPQAPIEVFIPTPSPSPPTVSPTPTSTPTSSPIPVPGQSFFFVESNSTISELFFNSTSSELSFTVSGPSDSAGYVKVSIAKSLVSSIQNVKVYLDGDKLDASITSDEDSWLLSFNYLHSTHNVKISFAANDANQTVLGIELLIMISIVIITVLIGLGLFLYIRKRK